MNEKIFENVRKITEKVAEAAIAAGRNPDEINILAASKYTDRSGIETIINAGIKMIGENRVQDAIHKFCSKDDGSQKDIHEVFPECRIHMIGMLQTNKINHALKVFDMIETVDRISLAENLEKRLSSILPVLVEVKLTDEETKTGCPESELNNLCEYIWRECPHIALEGFMGMGPWDPDPEVARPFYRKLKSLFEAYRAKAPNPSIFKTVSMGMSADFHIAIEEGATLVRIGRALFE